MTVLAMTASERVRGPHLTKKNDMEKTTNIQAIKEFFGKDSRPVSFAELKELDAKDRAELGYLCAKELGKELQEK